MLLVCWCCCRSDDRFFSFFFSIFFQADDCSYVGYQPSGIPLTVVYIVCTLGVVGVLDFIRWGLVVPFGLCVCR